MSEQSQHSRRPSEDDLIAQFFAPIAAPEGLGLKDDAACLHPRPGHDLVLTVDGLTSGVHFFANDPPASIARKALGVNVSDLAAKGAMPVGFLLTLALQDGWSTEWLRDFTDGLHRASSDWGCPLMGGDTVRASGPLSLSITAIGEVQSGAMRRRTAAEKGDAILVSGTIGDAVLGLSVLQGEMETGIAPNWQSALDHIDIAYIRDRYRHPVPRLGLAPILRAYAHAAMDVSDGLVGDLSKLLRASGLGAEVDLDQTPLSAAGRKAVNHDPTLIEKLVTGGDDYEILFTVPLDKVEAAGRAASALGIPLTAIGVVTEKTEGTIFRSKGVSISFERGSFSHF